MEKQTLNEAGNSALQQGAVSSRSCIGCENCKALSGKKMKISFVCLWKKWSYDNLKTFEEIKTLRCEKYVAENG